MAHTRDAQGFEPPNGEISRRAFVKGLGASAAATSLATGALAARRDQTPSNGEATILGPGEVSLGLRVNGEPRSVGVDPTTTLLACLREHLGLTGPKEICDRAACGGCSVLVDGKLTASCMMLAIDAAGCEVTTVEGLASGDTLDPLQEMFLKHDALQCGYCTPGFLVASRWLLDQTPKPALDVIKKALSGNTCRCGTYTNIFNAVLEASGQAVVMDSAS